MPTTEFQISTTDHLFTKSGSLYAAHRPVYPSSLATYLASLTPHHDLAYDVATGFGQIASMLGSYFKQVIASDVSANQLEHAKRLPNIQYINVRAEEKPTSIQDGSVDLIIVA